MFYLNSNDPFEEESLPKAYYFPSSKKSLSANQRKTCLNPGKMEGEPDETQSKEDAKFLSGSNKLSTHHEVATREDGTVRHDTSSGSQFDESWPSTDKNVSSFSSHHTPLSSSTPAEKETCKKDGMPFSGEKINSKKQPSQSTLSKYIERFRHGVPASRERRGNIHSAISEDFWWLSPPSSTSTPNEATETTVSSKFSPSSTTETSPKIRRKEFSKAKSSSAPLQKSGPKFSRGRPVRELVEAIDSDTDNLQTRADLLLEKSENTVSDLSTPESIPKRPSLWMLEKQKRLGVKDEPRAPVSRPHPAPEDDILYQWRLSRRLENAQKKARSSWSGQFTDAVTRQGDVPTHRIRSSVYTNEPGFRIRNEPVEEVIGGGEVRGIRKDPDYLSSKLRTEKAVKVVDVDNITHARNIEIPPNKTEMEPVLPRKEQKRCVGQNELFQKENGALEIPLETNVPAICFISEANLPAHVHMMCDIVPCSQHQEYLDTRGTRATVSDQAPTSRATIMETPSRSGEQIQESGKTKQNIEPLNDTPFPVVNTPNIFHPQRETNSVNIPYVPRSPRETNSVYTPYVSHPSRETNSVYTPYVSHPSRETNSVYTPYVSHPSRETNSVYTPYVSHPSRETNSKTADQIKVTNEVPQISLQHRMDAKNNDKTDGGDMIGNVIGQVISERLFSSMPSSRRSSINSNLSIESADEKVEKTKSYEKEQEDTRKEVTKECENLDEQTHATVDNTLVFPDDEILTRLRQQAEFYEEHLRNIDRLLEHMID